MKSTKQKRTEAAERLRKSTYKNSKAKRLKTATEAEWQKKKDTLLDCLKQMPTGY